MSIITVNHAKPKTNMKPKRIPAVCEKVCNHPIMKAYTNARNVNDTNMFTVFFIFFSTHSEKIETKKANEIKDEIIATAKTEWSLICLLDQRDSEKLKYRIPRGTGLKCLCSEAMR